MAEVVEPRTGQPHRRERRLKVMLLGRAADRTDVILRRPAIGSA
jgi:hypothetical protein